MDEWEQREAHYASFGLPSTPPGAYDMEFDPVERAQYTPKPLPYPVAEHMALWAQREQVPQADPAELDMWWRQMRMARWRDAVQWFRSAGRQDIFIFGAGASALGLDLHLLDGQVVYGINWTLRWFQPTFLQFSDSGPYERDIRRRVERLHGTLMVTSSSSHENYLEPDHRKYPLVFDMFRSLRAEDSHSYYYADWPAQPLTHFANSLGWALNIAAWFQPRKIVLIGFDFGGGHFFGDGRMAGAQQIYGLGGMYKPHLIPQLYKLREDLEARGFEVVQVGPTNLPVFRDKVYATVQEAIA